jgi:hypothetical protein
MSTTRRRIVTSIVAAVKKMNTHFKVRKTTRSSRF